MKHYDIAAYIWPAYHYEPRAEKFWPEKDGEWYTVRRATPRFPGHEQPRVPLLGYQDEANLDVARQHVAMGAKYGVNTFIMDWYWFDNEPCFERQLNDALMPALVGTESKFFLMWANHEALSVWDINRTSNYKMWTGRVTREQFEPMALRLIQKYLTHPNYLKFDGKPVLSLYDPANFVHGIGSVQGARDALDWLRAQVKAAGFPGLHLQFVIGNGPLPEETLAILDRPYTKKELFFLLGADSGTYYNNGACEGYINGEYDEFCASALRAWEKDEKVYPIFFPNASVGWDNTSRIPGYSEAIRHSTPAKFEAFLHKAKAYIDAHPNQPPMLVVNSWNEWTESSYLLPDTRWKYGYLEAIQNVFLKG